MADTLRIVARMRAADGKADTLVEHMKTLVMATREEPGCIQYDLHRGIEDPNILVFVEEWETEALWRAHMNGDAIRAFNKSIDAGSFASGEVLQLKPVI